MRSRIKLFLTDFDGVLTDGTICYAENGDISKRFHVHDGMGLELLSHMGIATGIITSDDSAIVDIRAKRLNFTHILKDLGKDGKLAATKKLCEGLGLKPEELAYMGDDVNCFGLLREVGYPACPADAQKIVQEIPHIYVAKLKGGQGALREWINYLLASELFDTDDSIESLLARNFAKR